MRRSLRLLAVGGMVAAGGLVVLRSVDGPAPACQGLQPVATVPDQGFTEQFVWYGNDDGDRPGYRGWTQGDGSWSVPITSGPDRGKTLWIHADTFLGGVRPPSTGFVAPPPDPAVWPAAPLDPEAAILPAWPYFHHEPAGRSFIRNSAVLADPGSAPSAPGVITETLSSTDARGRPASWIADEFEPLDPADPSWRRWEPMAAAVEHTEFGDMLRVLLLEKAAGGQEGTVTDMGVASVPVDDLRRKPSVVRFRPPPDPADADPGRPPAERKVFYGYDVVQESAWTYVYGANANRGDMSAYLARVPTGRLADPGAWTYFDGSDFVSGESRARAILPRTATTGVSHGYTTARAGSTRLLFTMDPTTPYGAISTFTAYWSCGVTGPWTKTSWTLKAPALCDPRVNPAVDANCNGGYMQAYNPHVHRQFTDPDGRLLLGYDVVPGQGPANWERLGLNLDRYRPKFLRLTLGPALSARTKKLGLRAMKGTSASSYSRETLSGLPTVEEIDDLFGLGNSWNQSGPGRDDRGRLPVVQLRRATRRALQLRDALSGRWPFGLGLGLGVLALGPALLPGFTLAYDMVFVPHWRYDGALLGLAGVPPRAVPSDLVAAALTAVLPGDLVQKLLLLSIFVIGCTGTDRLLNGFGARGGARLAAMVFFVWNPFVAERLLLGQWALLLGYAGLPWAVDAARRGSGRQIIPALLPAAVGGFMAMIITLLAVLPFRRWQVVAAWSALALPWLVPALLHMGDLPADGTGAAVFSTRPDTPFGAFGSLLCLSGVWNAEVVPPAYGIPAYAVLRLVLAVVLIGFGARVCRPLTVAAALGLAVAMCEVVFPGLLGTLIGVWPGFAVLRDAQQFVAPLALVQALGLAALVGSLRVEGAALLGTAAPLLLLPGMLFGGLGRLSAVSYPADFARARALMATDPEPGDVLLLPWHAHRSYPWNGGRGSLDALVRYLPRPVVFNDAVRIGARTVPSEDPQARALTPLVTSGEPLAEPLRRAGFRYVAIDAETGGFRDRFPGLAPVIDGPDLALYVLSPPTPKES